MDSDSKKQINKEQAWFWTERWQQGEREAEKDIRAGRVHHFYNAGEAIAYLHDRERKAHDKEFPV